MGILKKCGLRSFGLHQQGSYQGIALAMRPNGVNANGFSRWSPRSD